LTKAENTRKYIVEKTASIFNKKGFAGTSLSDLTAATGLTKGSIYGNFANKDEVALAVFDHNLGRLNDKMDARIAVGKTSIEKLREMANFYRSEFKSSLNMGGCPILNTAVDADDTHPALKQKVSAGIHGWKTKIELIVKKGVQNQEIRAGVNAPVFATEFIALIEGGIMLAKATGNISMLNTGINRVLKIIDTELAI
jgi:TetR/AcrR family transcriptional regulator, transcriptional repressor for nem operon